MNASYEGPELTMRINHLIVGSDDVKASVAFYRDILGFKEVDSFIDTGTGREGTVLVRFATDGQEELELLLVPFEERRLPNPQHIALEVDQKTFDWTYAIAQQNGLRIRAEPPLNSDKLGIGEFECRGARYRRYYLLDPGRVNVELMVRC